MQLYSCFFSKALGKNHIACYSVLRYDAVGALSLVVVFTGCQIQSFCGPITFIAYCPSHLICFNPITIDTVNAQLKTQVDKFFKALYSNKYIVNL